MVALLNPRYSGLAPTPTRGRLGKTIRGAGDVVERSELLSCVSLDEE